MCTPDTLIWFDQNLTPAEVAGKRILDVGAYDVNGSLREVIRPLHPAAYIGIDKRPGHGVDMVCPAEKLLETFGRHSFDVVVSSSTLEHVRHWRAAVANIKAVCKPGGLILLTMPSRWPFHAYPHDYWRYSRQDIEYIFADCVLLSLVEEEGDMALIYAKMQTPPQLQPQNLSGYALYSVITGRPEQEISRCDYFTPYFAQVLWTTTIRRKLAWWWLVVKMGVKLRLLAPLSRLLRDA